MDAILADLENKVQAAIRQTAEALERNTKLRGKATPEQLQQLDVNRSNLKYRQMRLATVSDILTGRAYVVVEKGGELFVHKGSDARLISLAEKMGLTKEFIQEKQKELF